MAAIQTGGDDNMQEQKAGEEGLRLGVHCTKDDRLKVSVIAPTLPKNLNRLPTVICCVVDTSGSMSSEAIIKDATGKTESHGLSILDLVKHAIKTIVHCLDDNDYLSIVSYSSNATVVTQLIKMDKKGKKKTLDSLENLRASGQTNLWDGLFNGLEILRKNKNIDCAKHNSAVLLFTDGLPNIIPPKGHQGMLDQYIDANQELVGIINTYGFGYSLDTKLLNDLAIKGNGSFGFIPDSSFVGTIFVNSISNLCCNVAKNVVVKVETNSKYNVQVIGGHSHLMTSWGVQLDLGTVMYDQNKDIVLQFTPKSAADQQDNTVDEEGKEGSNGEKLYDVDVNSLNYVSLRQHKVVKTAIDCLDDDNDNKWTQMTYYRLLACDVLRECMECMQLNDMDDAQKKLKSLIKEIRGNQAIAKEQYIVGLLADLSGQAFEAISKKEFYEKWGKHYMPSLIFAHLHQYNNNFKDPGVQNYGGALFNGIRDRANDIFIKLPPPKPSQPRYGGGHGGGALFKGKGGKKAAAAPVNMNAYYNVHGGCFHGDCNVWMADGSYKAVRCLRVNDVVCGGGVIQCVVAHQCEGNKMKLSNYNGLWITDYHPIRVNGEWVFPIDASNGNSQVFECDYVYNFVLSHGHVMMVNGVECCTLGHEMKSNAVIQHEYFGTSKVVDDLRKCNGWSNGMVVLDQASFKRDLDSQRVYKIIQ
eukprot:206471_1